MLWRTLKKTWFSAIHDGQLKYQHTLLKLYRFWTSDCNFCYQNINYEQIQRALEQNFSDRFNFGSWSTCFGRRCSWITNIMLYKKVPTWNSWYPHGSDNCKLISKMFILPSCERETTIMLRIHNSYLWPCWFNNYKLVPFNTKFTASGD
jgi:hypothetical protein